MKKKIKGLKDKLSDVCGIALKESSVMAPLPYQTVRVSVSGHCVLLDLKKKKKRAVICVAKTEV